ncbi:hypothetical protein K2173_007353 [Erythroxylum novogranatense]|uniref:Uncharacterized protein n=1 Tax=Erythroxylum novogranatense TaxID=1862640 RepID=A0AAV8S5U0_9ROSI|nr:hypothetical protein K2173_007353 [Erythroxylum novogranatense]
MASTYYNESNNCRLKIQVMHKWSGIPLEGQPNFGAIEIFWSATPAIVKLEVRDMNGYSVTGDPVKQTIIKRHCPFEVNLPWIVRYQLAILFYSVSCVLLLTAIGLTNITIAVFRQCLRQCNA